MTHRTLVLSLFAATALGGWASAALADPPARVGRIAYLEGDVSFQPPQEEDWTGAVVNYPVTSGEAFWTGDSGRAELQVGGVEARLDSETEVDVSALRYGEMRLGLAQGSLNLRVRGAPVGGVSVSTPAGDVHIDGRGFYRIDVGAPQDDGGYPTVEFTVFQGEAEAPGPAGYTPVMAGGAAVLYAGYDPQLQDAEDTAIDDWSRERARLERAAAYVPVPEGMTGVEDLGRYGDFVPTQQFGTVWFPRDTPPDWAPYRDGRWAYVAPWGYTWIDDAPWGFAPFHYGRWALVDGRWGWVAGQATTEPVYAPALVAFIGGRGWSVEGGIGGALGWVPLAPDEVYRPPYEVSDDYYRRANAASVSTTTFNTIVVNRTVTNVTVNTYRNAPAVTVVRADAFRGGLAVRRAMAPVSAEALARAPMVRPAEEAPPAPHAALALAPTGGMARRAAAPPPRLRAVRAAVAAPSAGANRPPVIAGARLTPPAPRPAGQPPATLIAPAQAHNPGAQHRQAATPPPSPGAAGAPSVQPPPAPDPAQAAAREARRKARMDAAQAAGASAPTQPPSTPTPPAAAKPSTPTAGPGAPDAQAAAAARRKARQEAARKAAAASTATPTSPAPSSAAPAPPPAAQPPAETRHKKPSTAPSAPDATTTPASPAAPSAQAPSTVSTPSAQSPADPQAQAKAQARRKARLEAARKAAAAQAAAAGGPPQ